LLLQPFPPQSSSHPKMPPPSWAEQHRQQHCSSRQFPLPIQHIVLHSSLMESQCFLFQFLLLDSFPATGLSFHPLSISVRNSLLYIYLLLILLQKQNSMLNGHAFFSTSAPKDKDDDDAANKASSSPSMTTPAIADKSDQQLADMKILRTLASYLWMKDNPEFRLRVLLALGFLLVAKVLNVQVPFLFKLAVDWLTVATGNATALASFTAANSIFLALFATPTSVLIGYGIARCGSSAFNGNLLRLYTIAYSLHLTSLYLLSFPLIFTIVFLPELRTAVFSKVALRTIRTVSGKVNQCFYLFWVLSVDVFVFFVLI